MKKLALLGFIAASLMLSGCATLNPFSGAFDQKTGQPKNTYDYERHVTVTPQYLVADPSGKVAVANHIVVDEKIGASITEPKKLNWFQWLWSKFKWWIILAVLIFVPGAAGVALFVAKRSAGLAINATKYGWEQTVKGIEKFLKEHPDQAAKDALLKSLSTKMDEDTKLKIKEIKSNLKTEEL